MEKEELQKYLMDLRIENLITINQEIKALKEIVDSTPNDGELGNKIRKFFTNRL